MFKTTRLRALLLASVPTLFSAAARGQSDDTSTILLGHDGADFFAVGGGKACVTLECLEPEMGTQSFSLSAHSDYKGDFGHWSVKVTTPDGELVVKYTVDVHCIHAHTHPLGKAAVIEGVVEKVEPLPNVFGVVEGNEVLLGVKDGGEGGSGFPVDDFFTTHNDALPPDVLPDTSCKLLFYEGNIDNVDSGNVVIKIN